MSRARRSCWPAAWRAAGRASGVRRPAAPPAAPVVMRNGTVRVVEAYGGSGGSAAIDWVPQRTDWLGQFLYSSPLAALAGGVSAAAAPDGAVHAAWTVGFPTLGTLSVVL